MLRHDRLRLVSLACLCCIGSGSVQAGGDDAASPVLTWSSIYFGAHAGMTDASANWHYNNTNPFSAFDPTGAIQQPGDEFSHDGAIAGGQIGLDHQLGQWVVGSEVSYSSLGLNETHESPLFRNLPVGQLVSMDISDLVVVSARVGFLLDPRLLVYLKGGYANAEVETSGVTDAAFQTGFDFSTSEREDGWIVGGGGEFRLTDALSLAVEYQHGELDGASRVGDLASLSSGFDVQHDVETKLDIVTVRLNWRWNRERASIPLK